MPPTALLAPKPRPYRRFLTSALHTRFVHAAGFSVLWSLIFAGLASDWYSSIRAFFWAFFPIGPAGFKAILFSFTPLLIYLLQISYLKVGRRTTPSKWKSIVNILTNSATYVTILWYLASAWWFTEVFVFTSPKSSNMGWVVNGGSGAPDRLNERPIYLRTFFLLLAVIQAAFHIYKDESTVTLPIKSIGQLQESSAQIKSDNSVVAVLVKTAPFICIRAGLSSLLATFSSPFVYSLILRQTLWNIHLTFAKAFADIPRSEATPPTNFYIGAVMVTAFVFGTMLSMTWQVTLLFFSTYVASAPLKVNRPLSAYSKDPNGTLLSGLTAKKELVKTFAFWEFDIIARELLPTRRRDIFGDFERLDQPPLFTSMLNATLAVIKSVQTRIIELDPTATPPAPSTNLQGGPLPPDPNIQNLPKLLPAGVPAKTTIFQTQPLNPADRADRLGRYFSAEARSIGSSTKPWSPPIDRTKQLAIEYTSPALDEARTRIRTVQQSNIGQYLLAHPIRLVKSAVLGTPNANAALTVHAVSGLSGFLVKSAEEDLYGKAVAGVPETIINLTKTIFAIERFVKTQIGDAVTQDEAKDLKEVTIVHQNMKACLKEIMTPFQHFLVDVGLSIRELNEAKSAAEDRPLFQIIRPEPKSVRKTQTAPPNGATREREMEEVGRNIKQNKPAHGKRETVRPSVEEEDGNEAELARRRQSRTLKAKQQEDQDKAEENNRPGRLFSVLDKGSAYNSMREKQRQQVPEQGSASQNPEGLRRRSSGKMLNDAKNPKKAGDDNLKGDATGNNVFGARDFNSLPAGGLDRRKVGAVR